MEKVIKVENLRKVYKYDVAVENVSFELGSGSIMGLLGSNGASKTTTLKMITNLCIKDNGKVVIDGVSLDNDPVGTLSKVGEALDTTSFYGELTAKENMEYFARLHKDSGEKQVMELLDSVGLGAQTENILSEEADMVDCVFEASEDLESILSGFKGISIVSHIGNKFTVRLETVSLETFIKRLVEKNLHIKYISMHKNSLQGLFLKLTGEQKNVYINKIICKAYIDKAVCPKDVKTKDYLYFFACFLMASLFYAFLISTS